MRASCPPMVTQRACRLLGVLLALLVVGQVQPGRAETASAEQELIERHTPILMLAPQRSACDGRGEPYVAGPIDLVLGDPSVVLRKDEPGQPIVARGPTARDLVNRDEAYYLDLPGNPLRPGCSYEQRSRTRMSEHAPTTYAHLAREQGRSGFAIQYWFFYYFNDFNNTHEGDWEMIQVVFDVDTAEAALGTEPIEVGYAQHGGGEWTAWDDPKLEREGTHPVVYASRGSHASQFDRAVYLMWGENNTGFGCDITETAETRVPLTPELVDGGTNPTSTATWLSYEGRWGQKEAWEFSGPRTPSQSAKWSAPLTWQDSLRADSFAVPLGGALGPTPTDVFCKASSASSHLARLATEHLWRALTFVAAALAIVILLLTVSRQVLWTSLRLYLQHPTVFIPANLAVIAVGILIGSVRWLADVAYDAGPVADTPALWSAFVFVGHILQPLVSLIVVAPMVISGTAALLEGRRLSFEQMLSRERTFLGDVARALLRPAVLIGLLGLVPFGAVPATYLTIQRSFIPHAVVLDGDVARAAWARSVRFVRGRWWRTAALNATLAGLVAVPGPLVGLALLILAARSLAFVNIASSLVYAFVVPFAFVATTIYYTSTREPEPNGLGR